MRSDGRVEKSHPHPTLNIIPQTSHKHHRHTIDNPLNPPGVGWVNLFYFFKVRVSICTCLPNLGAVRRSCRKKTRSTLIICNLLKFISRYAFKNDSDNLLQSFTYKIPFLKGCISLANEDIYQIWCVWIAGQACLVNLISHASAFRHTR